MKQLNISVISAWFSAFKSLPWFSRF